MPPRPSPYAERFDFNDAQRIYMPRRELDGALREAVKQALPPGTVFCFNFEEDQAWLQVSKPGKTNEVLSSALRILGREETPPE